MNNRAVEIAGFLAQNGWDGAEQIPFDADFSPRRYARLLRDDNTRAILMDADPDQKTDDFVIIATLLKQLDISAPEILVESAGQGLVIMEDLGSRNLGNALDSGAEAKPIYRRAVDVLIHIHKNFDKAKARELDLPMFGGALLASQVELFLDYYVPHVRGRETTHEEGEAFRAAWKETLRGIEALPQSLMLRDFMPDNLMDLPKREGVRDIGVLDFQDAGVGPIAYDLASLCEVVRRDGGGVLLSDILTYYYQKAQPELTMKDLENACNVLAAQRHMRILGILAKLAKTTGRREKLSFMPRIIKYLGQLLQNENLKPVETWAVKGGLL